MRQRTQESPYGPNRNRAPTGDGATTPSRRRPGRRPQAVEGRLLLVAQPVVEGGQRRLHGLHRRQRGIEPLFHRLDPTGLTEPLIAPPIPLAPLPPLHSPL